MWRNTAPIVQQPREGPAHCEVLQAARNGSDIFVHHCITPLKYAAKHTGISDWNICKLSKNEVKIVEQAASSMRKNLMATSKPGAWFPKAKRVLYSMFLARRKRSLKVSTLGLSTIMSKPIKEHHRNDKRVAKFTCSQRCVRK